MSNIDPMYRPFISLIIAVYNGAKYLEHCLESIINQTYENVEIIIVDGGSSDSTVDIIRRYEKHITYWISEPDKGIYDAWNKGLTKSRGVWICFMGADDFYVDNFVIENSIQFLNQAQKRSISFVYGKVQKVDPVTLNVLECMGKPWEEIKEKFTNFMCLPHPGSFHHKSLFEIHGEFNCNFKIAGDYDFLLREFSNKSNDALFMEEVITTNMRVDGVSGDFKKSKLLLKEIQLARKRNGITHFSYELQLLKLRFFIIKSLNVLFGKQFAQRIQRFYRKHFIINIIDGKFVISSRK